MSDTELLDVVAVVKATNVIIWVDKEKPRNSAEAIIADLTERANGIWDDRFYVTAPCGRYARGDRYVKEED